MVCRESRLRYTPFCSTIASSCIGLGWAKSLHFHTGQRPVMRYNRQLMQAILYGKAQIAKAVNVTVIALEKAPQGYTDFDRGAAKKFVLDPHGALGAAA